MSVSGIKELLEKYGITPNKALGQNFLADDIAAEEIAQAACCGLPVIEIGPGMGALTEKLLQKAEKVAAVEIDNRMADIIEDRFKGEKLQVYREDFLKIDLDALVKSLGGEVSVAGNLPYYITTPICTKLMETEGIRSMTLMMQKEAAERFFAKPKDRVYGPMTVLAGYYYDIKELIHLSREAYYPKPEVDSAVLQLTKKDVPSLPKLSWLANAAFAMRRKTLQNNLKAAGLTAEEIQTVCESSGISPLVRGEALSIEEFAKLAGEVGKNVEETVKR